MNKRTFTVDELEEMGLPYEADPELLLEDEHVGSGRWQEHHRLIIRVDEKLWAVPYSVGLTEMQDERPWEYDGPTIQAVEVEAYEKTVTRYREVSA